MTVTVFFDGDAKEIAALVLALQGQQNEKDFCNAVMNRIQERVDQSEPVFRP